MTGYFLLIKSVWIIYEGEFNWVIPYIWFFTIKTLQICLSSDIKSKNN